MCQTYGYEYEEHLVTSDDGYVTMLQRIRARLGDEDQNREPFYISMFPGAFEAALFLRGPDESPGFRIVDAGFDLWFLNPRGSANSLGHVNHDITPAEYWHYDLVDMAQDQIAALNFILDTTGYSQVHAQGFSTGGLLLGYAIALNPEFFNPRISSLHYVAGTMNYANTRSFQYQFLASIPDVLATLEDFGFYQTSTPNIPINVLQGTSCSLMPHVCIYLWQFAGIPADPNYDDTEGFSNYLYRGLPGFGTHLMAHIVQSFRTKQVSYFDYGEEGNLEAYGQDEPPRIPYENHDLPVAMYYSYEDDYADMEDAEWFADILGDTVVTFNKYSGYSHFSFEIGKDMYYLDDMFDVLQDYPIEVSSN